MIRNVLTALFLTALIGIPVQAMDDASPVQPIETRPDYLDTLRTRLDAAMADPRMVGLVAAVIEAGEPGNARGGRYDSQSLGSLSNNL